MATDHLISIVAQIEPATAAQASMAVVAGGFAAGFVVRLLIRAAKSIAKRTPTKHDDRMVELVEEWIDENPEAIVILERIVKGGR